jgi:uncharacterized protein
LEKTSRINDFHVHLGKSDGIYRSLPVDQVIPYIEENNIENIALIPFELDTDDDNLKIIKLSKEHKSIHGLFWIQKHRIQKDLDVLNKELGDSLIGVKFHGSFEKLPITNEVYSPILELLNNKNSILLIHCGRFKDGNFDSDTSYLHGIEIAKKYPNIKIVLAHMGGNDTSIVKKAVKAAIPFPNIYFDTSGISTPYRVEYAVNAIGPNRIIFGSDYPWCSFRGNYYNIEDSLLDEKTKQCIFYDNFINLIK